MRIVVRRLALLLAFSVVLLCFASSALADPASPAPAPATVVHWVVYGWIGLTAIVNTISHYATPADVDAWAERNPRIAQLAAIMRRAGFEPIALIQAVYGFFAGNPPPPGHAAAIGRRDPRLGAGMRAAGAGFMRMRDLVAAGVCAFVIGCAGLFAAIPAVSALGLCAYDFIEQHPGLTLMEYIAQAAASCSGDELAILDQVASDENPPAAVKPLQTEAKALKAAGGERLRAFATQAHARALAIRAAKALP